MLSIKPCLHTQLLEHNKLKATEKFPGVGAFDHLEWIYEGAFEQLFGLGRGEFEQKFSKNSNARGVAGGGDVEASSGLVHKIAVAKWRELTTVI